MGWGWGQKEPELGRQRARQPDQAGPGPEPEAEAGPGRRGQLYGGRTAPPWPGCRTEPHDRRTQLLPRGRGIRRGAAYAWQQGLRANNRSPSAQAPGDCGFGLALAAAEAPPRRPRTAVAAAVRPKAELHHPQSAASDRERSRQVGSRSARRGSPPPTPARAAVSAAPNLSSRCCGGCGASSAGSDGVDRGWCHAPSPCRRSNSAHPGRVRVPAAHHAAPWRPAV